MGNCNWGTGGSGADELVKVTAADTTADYLASKIAAGSNVSLSTLNPGANEQLEISASLAGGSAANAFGYNDTAQNMSYPIQPNWTDDFNTLSGWQAGPVSEHSISNGQITIGRDGRNAVQASLSFDAGNDSHTLEFRLVKNGVEIPGSRNQFGPEVDQIAEVTVFAIDDLSLNDVVELEMRTTNGGSSSIDLKYVKIEAFELSAVAAGDLPHGEVVAESMSINTNVLNAWFPFDPWTGADNFSDVVGVAGITITTPGPREVSLSLSLSGAANSEIEIAITKNGVVIGDSVKPRDVSSVLVGNMSTSIIDTAAAGDLYGAAIRRTDAGGGTQSIARPVLFEHLLSGSAGESQAITAHDDLFSSSDLSYSYDDGTPPTRVSTKKDGPGFDDLVYVDILKMNAVGNVAIAHGTIPKDWNGNDPTVTIDMIQEAGSLSGTNDLELNVLIVPADQPIYPDVRWDSFDIVDNVSLPSANFDVFQSINVLTPHVNGGGAGSAGDHYLVRMQFKGNTGGSLDPFGIVCMRVSWPVD